MKAIVTGSEGLIGKAVSEYLKQEGYLVAQCDIFLNPLHDLTNEENVRRIFEVNKADALINCYAYNPSLPSSSINSFSLDEFRKYMEINVVSLFNVCREFIKNNDKGSIVNFSSLYGKVSPNPNNYFKGDKDIAYGISKAGVIALTKQLATHYPAFNINCVIPGGVYNNQDIYFINKFEEKVPLGRMMNVKELPPLVEFLINPEKNSYITGAEFVIDGGYLSW